MATRAVIVAGSKYFYVPHDGYPTAVVPDLVSLLKEAAKVSERTGRNVVKELSYLIFDDEVWEPITELDAANAPKDYEYFVRDDKIEVLPSCEINDDENSGERGRGHGRF